MIEANSKLDKMENKEEIQELSQTCEIMCSKDYKERFKAEFYQLKIRIEKLDNYLAKICVQKNELYEKQYNILDRQLVAMEEYLFILKQRSILEHIDIL